MFICACSVGRPRGFAFISFDDYDAVDQVILGKPHVVNGRTLDVKKAIPKDEMSNMNAKLSSNIRSTIRRDLPAQNHYSSLRDNDFSSHSNHQYDRTASLDNHNPTYNSSLMSTHSSRHNNMNALNCNPLMNATETSTYASSYSTNMARNQRSSIMTYDSYNNKNTFIPYNSTGCSNYFSSSPIEWNYQQSNYNPNAFHNVSSSSDSFETSSPYGITANNYNAINGNNYHSTSQLVMRAGGPMRDRRG
jgi:hypothetical protein